MSSTRIQSKPRKRVPAQCSRKHSDPVRSQKKSKDEKSDEENGKATNGAPIGRPHMAARMRYMRGKHEESTLPETFL